MLKLRKSRKGEHLVLRVIDQSEFEKNKETMRLTEMIENMDKFRTVSAISSPTIKFAIRRGDKIWWYSNPTCENDIVERLSRDGFIKLQLVSSLSVNETMSK